MNALIKFQMRPNIVFLSLLLNIFSDSRIYFWQSNILAKAIKMQSNFAKGLVLKRHADKFIRQYCLFSTYTQQSNSFRSTPMMNIWFSWQSEEDLFKEKNFLCMNLPIGSIIFNMPLREILIFWSESMRKITKEES